MTKAPTWMMNQSHFTSDTTEMAPRKADPTQARSAPMAPAMSSVGAPERMPTAQETEASKVTIEAPPPSFSVPLGSTGTLMVG
jgi:hypothetical protein